MRLVWIIFFFLFLINFLFAQSDKVIQKYLLSAAGKELKGNKFILNFAVGEIGYLKNKKRGIWLLSEGYIQNEQDLIKVKYEVFSEHCEGTNNGRIILDSDQECKPPYTLEVMDTLQTKIFNPYQLSAGTYNGIFRGGELNCRRSFRFTVSLDKKGCELEFYTGITPNDDGHNDSWTIKNIQSYKDNNVVIFNRFGNTVWQADNYDNNNIKFTGVDLNGKRLPNGTYFYIAKIEDKDYQGWIELIY